MIFVKKRFTGLMLIMSLLFTIAPIASAAQVTEVIDYTRVKQVYDLGQGWHDAELFPTIYYKTITYMNGYTNVPSSTSYSDTFGGLLVSYRYKYVYYTTTTN